MATTTMLDIEAVLGSAVSSLSNENYEQLLARYHFWFQLGQTYSRIPSDLVFDTIWNYKRGLPSDDYLIYPTSPLLLRFASDAESSRVLAPHAVGLRSRLCTRILQEFFDADVKITYQSHGPTADYFVDANLIAHCANLGYIEEASIRDHILQSLTSHLHLSNHQVNALIILFKVAGATFEAYADPLAIDRCFDLLTTYWESANTIHRKLITEVIILRRSGWEGLPPPPLFTTGKPKPISEGQEEPSETPAAIPMGLPNVDFEPQISLPPTLESVTTPEIGAEATPASPTMTQSPSISIATLSDFTTADTPDDQPFDDPTVITPHGTFYLDDGNVEVLCGNTLFRVHTSVLSFHSPVLRQVFAQASLEMVESPNGCPRILSSDTAMDFTTLLKVIYLPGFPERSKAPDFNTFSSLLRMTAKYEMPAVQSDLLEVVNDAYPETFEGVTPTKSLGENVFSGPPPHPNEALNLFIQQKLTSALPMAYYMAVRRGVDSLMDKRLSQSATLPPEILQSAIKGLITLRELELNETHRLVLRPKASHSSSNCPLCEITGPGAPVAHQRVIDRITGSSRSGTKVLEVLSLGGLCGDNSDGFCESCVRGWEAGHVEVRERAWDMLPNAFGLKG